MVRLFLILMLMLPCIARAEGDLSLHIVLKTPVDRPIVGQMIEITLRGRYDRHIANEKILIPPTDAFDWIQTRADSWFEERQEGKKWTIYERHLAIWPKRSGILTFGPIEHQLTILDTKSQRMQAVVRAEPLAISIGEHPQARGWKFAANALELTESLSTDPARLEDGGTVTRQITLRALGALPEHLPPRPVVSEPWLITFAAPIKRELLLTPEGPLAEVVWEWQFRPEHGEPGVIEPVKIPWFDNRAHAMAEVEIPAITIGYASFYTGQTPKGSFSAKKRLYLLLTALAGALLGGLVVATRVTPIKERRALHQALTRVNPLNWLRFWRARLTGDLLAERRLAEELNLSAKRRAYLDDRIYRRP